MVGPALIAVRSKSATTTKRFMNLLLLAAFVGLLPMVAGASEFARQLPRVFLLGDSISIQYGPALESYLQGVADYDRKRDGDTDRAAADLDLPQGANGGNSARLLAYLKARRANGGIPADWLVFNCGLHDIKTDPVTGRPQVVLGQYKENLRACLAEARAMHLRAIWINITPIMEDRHNQLRTDFKRFTRDIDAYNAAADRIMREAAVPVIDLHGFSMRLIPAGLADHVHFNESAQHLQAAFIAGSLRVLLYPSTPNP